MSDRRPENPELWTLDLNVSMIGDHRDDPEESWVLVDSEAYPATSEDLIAAVRRGVESGTIKGEVFWMIPDEYEHLRGSLWTGPPTDGKGYAVLVIPVEGGEDR